MAADEIRVVGKLIEEKARVHKDRPFLYFKDEVYTYEQLDKVVAALDEVLTAELAE